MTTAYLLDTDGHLIEARFELDGFEETFPGYHNPNRTWNGWSCPFFTKAQAERVTKVLGGIYDDEGDRFIICDTNPDDPSVPAEALTMDENGLYDNGYWDLYRASEDLDGAPLYTSSGICWMRAEQESEAEQWVTRLADAMRAEVIALMQDGTIPLNVHVRDKDGTWVAPFPTEEHPYGPFSRLHDYCDANMLGEEVGEAMQEARKDEDDDGWEQGDATEIFNVAMERVDRWLSYGGHLWLAEDDVSPVLLVYPTYQGIVYWTDGSEDLLSAGADPAEVKLEVQRSRLADRDKFPRHWTVTVVV